MRPALAVLAALIVSTPVLATWREASTDKFLVYSDGSEKSLVEFTERVDKFDQVLRAVTGFNGAPSPLKVRIYLVDDAATVRTLYPQHVPRIGGFYHTTLAGGIGVANRTRASNEYQLDGETILCHEYVHHFMAQYFPFVYPRWYQEGLAELFATTQFDKGGRISVGGSPRYRLRDLYTTNWIGTGPLMQDSGQLLSTHMEAFYAQSWLLAHYFFDSPQRAAQLQEYLQMRGQGIGHAEALQKAFGLSDSQLDQEVHAYFGKHTIAVIQYDALRLVTPAVSVRILPPSADALLLLGLRLELGLPDDETKSLLEKVRASAARFSDDDAQLTLARAEARYGDRARALEVLTQLLAKDPSDRGALLQLGWLQLAEKEQDAAARRAADRSARSLAVRANRLAHDDPQALFLFYQSFAHEPEGPSQNAIDGLAAAYLNLPQYSPLAVSYVNELLRAHDAQHAVRILERLAYAPHGGKSAQWAQAQLQKIQDAPPQNHSSAHTDEP